MAKRFPGIGTKLSLVLALGALSVQTAGQDALELSAMRRVISADEIKSAGLTHLADILLLLDDWSIASLDGFQWKVSVNGLSAFQEQDWIVMVDGQRIDLKVFDAIYLNHLPVSLELIDSIQVFSVPVIHEGEFADRGLIHIHTKRPRSGVALEGSEVVGQKTGDPGPHLFTEFTSPNVDHILPGYTLSTRYGARSWNATANLVVNQYPATYSAIGKLNNKMISEWPGMLNIAPGLRIEWDRHPHTYELVSGYSTSKEHFIYFPPFGREVPVYSRFGYIGFKGRSPVKNRWQANYRIRHSFIRFDKFPNIMDIDFDWASINWHGGLELASQTARLKKRVGMKFDRYTLDTGYRLDQPWLQFVQAYSTLAFSHPQDVHHSLGGMVTTFEDKVALKGLVSTHWRINPAQQAGVTVAYTQRLAPEDNNVWYWFSRGYDLLSSNGIDYSACDDLVRSQQLTGDAFWQVAVNDKLMIRAGAGYRHFSDLPVLQYHFKLNPEDGALSSSTSCTGGNRGEVIGGSILVEYEPTGQVHHRLAYGYSSATAGTRAFRDTRRAVPEHKASYQVTVSPAQNFSIWAMLTYTSTSVWVDYTEVDGLIPFPQYSAAGTYVSSLGGSTSLDLQLQKWFWHRRILANLLFRNLCGEPIRYHPVGTIFDLSFFAQVYFFFDSETLR